MANAAADRHLLFGLLALQNGIISQVQLVAAFQAWTLDKTRSLADHLEARGDLTAARRALLEGLAEVHLEAHGGEVDNSLAAVSVNRSARARLAELGEPEIDATLDRIGAGNDGEATDPDDDRTASFAVGTATSDGQRFRVLRPHAQGALGAVFVALDAELNREVALKQILDHHADSPASRQRFLIEAEITGGLEHPGIVPVYGLGTYAGGRPYYAMRFIKGDSLKEAIKRFHGDVAQPNDPAGRSLALRKLLRRFTDVCNAIDYAHSRGVLHRDIKPGNIIVGKYGETLVVDWGLAKPLGRVEPGQESGERTLVPSSASGSAETLAGSALGTPAYMSPEQASGELDRLGSPSDVYSLGATLYSLLTGRPPFVGDDMGEVLGKVRRGEFVPPRSLDATIDPALEAVCLKAMALKPEDRYATCRAPSDDVERWMADEPVSAWPEPLSRRARRWARRNRTAFTALGASVLVALAGTGVVLAVQTQAKGRLQQANFELAAANAREKQRFDLAMEAIKLFHGEVGDDLVLKADEFKPLRDRLLRGALDFYSKLEGLLKDQPDRGSRGAMGDAYFELGDLTSKIGDKPGALAAHRKGLAVRRELASEPVADAEARGEMANSLNATADLLDATGNSAEALARYEEARDLLEGLPQSGTGSGGRRALLSTVYWEIGVVFEKTGKTAAAMSAYERSLATLTRLVDDNPAVTDFRSRQTDSHNRIGHLQSETGKPGEALESYRRALAIGQKLADDNPDVTTFRFGLADTHLNIGRLQWQTGRPGEALESYRRALVIQQKLADDNPAVTNFRNSLASSHNNIGILQMDTGKPVEALESYRRALVIKQKLADDNPAITNFRNSLAHTHNNIGNLQSQTGKPVEALESYRRALAIRQKLADDNPDVTTFRNNLAVALNNIGNLQSQTGRPGEALESYRRALAIGQKLTDENPNVPNYRGIVSSSHNSTADVLRRLGRNAEAREGSERAIAIRERLVQDNPTVYRSALAESLRGRGLARLGLGELAGAAADTRRALEIWDGLPSRSGGEWFETACGHAALANLAGRAGSGMSAGEADAEAVKALALLRRAAAMGFRDPASYSTETALDPLRDRPDFRLLMMDLAMPAQLFAE